MARSLDRLSAEFGSRKFLKFLIAGGIAALANIFSRIAFSVWIPYVGAIVLAYLVGLVTAYGLNRLFVFGRGKRTLVGEAGFFVLVNILAIGQTIIVSVALAHYVLPTLGIVKGSETIAHVVGVMVPVFTSFVGHKYWSFKGHQL